jgi:hypothetical protein
MRGGAAGWRHAGIAIEEKQRMVRHGIALAVLVVEYRTQTAVGWHVNCRQLELAMNGPRWRTTNARRIGRL